MGLGQEKRAEQSGIKKPPSKWRAGKEVSGMKVLIEAEPKEIAALVVEIQERHEDEQVQLILNHLQEKLHQSEAVFQP